MHACESKNPTVLRVRPYGSGVIIYQFERGFRVGGGMGGIFTGFGAGFLDRGVGVYGLGLEFGVGCRVFY